MYLYKKNSYKSSALGLWVKFGSKNDPIYKEGLHHFIEHLVFRDINVKIRQEILNKTGITYNAFTSHEIMAFIGTSIHSDEQHLFYFLNSIKKCSLEITDKDFETERSIILKEIEYYETQPYELLKILCLKSILGINNPLSHPIYGTKNSILNINKQDIIKQLSNIMDNCFIIKVGNLDDYGIFTNYDNLTVNNILNNKNLYNSNKNNGKIYWSNIDIKDSNYYIGFGLSIPFCYKENSISFSNLLHKKLLNTLREKLKFLYRINKTIINTKHETIIMYLFQTNNNNFMFLKNIIEIAWEEIKHHNNLNELLNQEKLILQKNNFIKSDNSMGLMKEKSINLIFNTNYFKKNFKQWLSFQNLNFAILLPNNQKINGDYCEL